MSKFSVIILSKDVQNLVPCIKAVKECEPGASIVVVDDGVETTVSHAIGSFQAIRDLFIGVDLVDGEKPFVFSRNVNIGIREAMPEDDIVLLNDDALIKTVHGLTEIGDILRTELGLEYGLMAPTCDGVGNPNQHPRGLRPVRNVRDEPRMVCFACVYIPRRTIDKVGLLDERFVDYGLDDDSYCFSVREAGLKLGIYDGCFVNHSSLTSSFRGHGRAAPFENNMRRFIEKWGTDNWGKKRGESEFAHLFPEEAK